eukprot:789253-Prymnesium_polylepis.2
MPSQRRIVPRQHVHVRVFRRRGPHSLHRAPVVVTVGVALTDALAAASSCTRPARACEAVLAALKMLRRWLADDGNLACARAKASQPRQHHLQIVRPPLQGAVVVLRVVRDHDYVRAARASRSGRASRRPERGEASAAAIIRGVASPTPWHPLRHMLRPKTGALQGALHGVDRLTNDGSANNCHAPRSEHGYDVAHRLGGRSSPLVQLHRGPVGVARAKPALGEGRRKVTLLARWKSARLPPAREAVGVPSIKLERQVEKPRREAWRRAAIGLWRPAADRELTGGIELHLLAKASPRRARPSHRARSG